jgi:regulator of CtrA degradation
MAVIGNEVTLTNRLIDSLYTEAMILTDEARAYFDEAGQPERLALPPILQVGFSCEALKVTTRLMHVVAWLLTRRAEEAGEMPLSSAARSPARRLGAAAASSPAATLGLPEAARQLIEESSDLYDRVQRLDQVPIAANALASPAHSLLQRLERHWG